MRHDAARRWFHAGCCGCCSAFYCSCCWCCCCAVAVVVRLCCDYVALSDGAWGDAVRQPQWACCRRQLTATGCPCGPIWWGRLLLHVYFDLCVSNKLTNSTGSKFFINFTGAREGESGRVGECGRQSGQLHREIALHLLIATSWQVAQLATVCCLQLSWAQNFSLPDRTPKLHKTLRPTQKKIKGKLLRRKWGGGVQRQTASTTCAQGTIIINIIKCGTNPARAAGCHCGCCSWPFGGHVKLI